MVRLPTVRTVFWLLALAGAAKAATSFSASEHAGQPARVILASASGSTAPAQPAVATATASAAAATATATATATAAATGDAKSCDTPEQLLQSVRQERALIAKQKAALADRAAKLDLAKQEVDTETKRLSELKDTVQALLKKATTQHSADVDRLVKLYQSMKPVDAAAMLNSVDMEVAVMVLATMNERNAAQIMSKMAPDRVQAVSKIILERSKLPGDQNQVVVNVN